MGAGFIVPSLQTRDEKDALWLTPGRVTQEHLLLPVVIIEAAEE